MARFVYDDGERKFEVEFEYPLYDEFEDASSKGRLNELAREYFRGAELDGEDIEFGKIPLDLMARYIGYMCSGGVLPNGVSGQRG